MSDLILKENPNLKDFQQYVHDMIIERGFDKETTEERFMLFMEECGELAKAARKFTNVKSDKNSEHFELEKELADVFIYVLAFADEFNIDLEKAFRDKEEINKQRVWE